VSAGALLLAAAVGTGLDGVAAGRDEALRGRRLGLLCHAASVAADGRHAIDVLRARGLDVRRLFAPEHGLRGEAAAGEVVGDGLDRPSGLPVVSLYGRKTRPSLEELRGLDLLVVDLQDAGVRFYTYASTMLLAMEAAAEAGVGFLVLDRPNPLGGERLEGPRSDPPGLVPPSLVNLAPGPLVHGLTLGEMARLAAASRGMKAPQVLALQGWRRSMSWDDTGLPWIPPSPNLRTAETALAYPGTCLLEATNVSEGRGTDGPFLLFGAPWLKPEALRAALEKNASRAGFGIEPSGFTPRSGPAAPAPKHEGRACRGFRLRVVDRARARPYALGVALLHALRREPGFAWRDGGRALDRLLGTRRLRSALEAGLSPEQIVAADEPDLEAFRRARADALLYP
jgi:uncharacterized protein YbbC (DUF1343 family)